VASTAFASTFPHPSIKVLSFHSIISQIPIGAPI
jgi:hypothetical protein